MLSFCDNKYFPSSWKNDDLGYLSMDLNIFYEQPTQGEVKDSDGQVKDRSDLDELLGISTGSMNFDVTSVEGEAHIQTYIQVQQVPNDTDPLMWWNQYHQEFPDLTRMVRQYLEVPDTSVSPERFFSRVGLVQTDFRGRQGTKGATIIQRALRNHPQKPQVCLIRPSRLPMRPVTPKGPGWRCVKVFA